ncbi:MAG: hypothetical protein ISR76_04230 [Planctomycetes bacterium]|nr:hypothetical protein [Planctomycetota bacterium]
MHPLPKLLLALLPLAAGSCGAADRAGEPLAPGQDLWALLDLGLAPTVPDPSMVPEHPDPATVHRSGQFRLDLILLRGPLDAASPFDRPEAWRRVATPSLLMMAGQPASISLLSETSFVADFTTLESDQVLLADPQVGVLQTGLQIHALVEEREGRLFRGRIRFHRSELERMVLQETTLRGHSEPITTQLPAVALAESEVQIDADRGLVRLYQLPLLPGDDEIELLAVRLYPVEEDPPRGQVRRQRLTPRTAPSGPWPPAESRD